MVCSDAEVAVDTSSVHTPTMTLKNAALLALIGTVLMTAVLMWNLIFTFLNVLRDLVPAVTLFQSFIYAVGCFSVAVFFTCSTEGSRRDSSEGSFPTNGCGAGDPKGRRSAGIWLPEGGESSDLSPRWWRALAPSVANMSEKIPKGGSLGNVPLQIRPRNLCLDIIPLRKRNG